MLADCKGLSRTSARAISFVSMIFQVYKKITGPQK